MNSKQAAKLFEPFSQTDASTTRMFGGTGLGLAISKRLAEALGGSLELAKSRPGMGSCFRLTVAAGSLEGVAMIDDPEQAARKPSVREKKESPATRSLDCRILVAEDNPVNQRLIKLVLKKNGAEVALVENGKLAVKAALEARDAGEPFDVILMDMSMPVMDGYMATERLRKEGYTGPIIALTAHAMASDRKRCLDAGCDDYASKPIDRAKLLQAIEGLLQR
jgi:Amt family ammonium transporter